MKNLRVAHIKKSFGHTAVLADVSFELAPRQIGILIGSSGSGKSTLAKIIGGLLAPDMGQVLFDAVVVLSPNQKLVAGHERIKLVSQDFGLMPHISARHNIYQGMMRLLDEEKLQISNKLIEVLHLQNVADHLAKHLSGGQQQRVAIAQMLAAKADLYLFDEVFSQLDLATKQHVMFALKAFIKAEKASALFILHDATDAFALADIVFVLQNGSIVQKGTAHHIYSAPKNEYVAGLFGVYNLLPKKVFQTVFHSEGSKLHHIDDAVFFRPHQLQTQDFRGSHQPTAQIHRPDAILESYHIEGYTIWLQRPL